MDEDATTPWGRTVTAALCIGAAVVLVGVTLAGYGLGLYHTVVWLDGGQHFLSGAVLAPLAIYLLPRQQRTGLRTARWQLWLTAVLLFMGIAAMWEVLEWVLDLTASVNLSKGYTDTLLDLALGLAGGALSTAALVSMRAAGSAR